MATETDIVNAYSTEINWDDKVKYGDLIIRTNGQKSVNLGHEKATNKLFIMSPEMMTWGINEVTDPITKEIKGYDFNLQFPMAEELKNNPDAKMFLENMKNLEEKLKSDAVKQSGKWFNRPMSREQIEVIWTPMIKYPKNKDTGMEDYNKSPTIKVKVPFYDGKFKGEFYNMKQEPIYLPDDHRFADVNVPCLIKKLANVYVMAVNGGLWFVGNKFGTTWRLQQVVVENKEIISGRCMLKPKNTCTDNDLETVCVSSVAQNVLSTEVEDSDDDNGVTESSDVITEESDKQEQDTKPTNVSLPKKKKVSKK